MKNKILLLVFALVAFLGFTGCKEKTPTETDKTQTAEQISQELKNARDYIKNIYIASEGAVTADLDRAAKVPVSGKEFTISWAVNVTSGKADAVSVSKADDNSKYVVSVTYGPEITEEVVFALTATITAPDGEQTTLTFNHRIPVFEANTVSQFVSEKNEDKVYFLEGVITAVNKSEGNTAFIITDETGSLFCYDGLEVELGQKVQVTGNYSAYGGAFPQLTAPQLVNVLAENQDVVEVSGTPLVTTVDEINAAAKAEGVTAADLVDAYAGKFLEVTGYVVMSGSYCNMAVAADVASCCQLYANDSINLKQFVSAKVVVKGFARGVSVGNGITIQIQSVELAPGETMPEQETKQEPAVVDKTLAEILAMAEANNLKAAYNLTVTVSKLGQKDTDTSAGKYGNLWVTDGTNEILVYGATATRTALAWDEALGLYTYSNAQDFLTNDLTKDIKVGDELDLLVVRTSYQGTPQLNAIVLSVTPGEPGDDPAPEIEEPAVVAKTIAELLAIAKEDEMKASFTLTTTVKGLGSGGTGTDADKYGNMMVTDGTNEILVYGSTATRTALAWNGTVGKYSFTNPQDFLTNDLTKDIKVGDEVDLLVVRTSYNTTLELYAIVLDVTPAEPGDDPAPEIEEPEAVAKTIAELKAIASADEMKASYTITAKVKGLGQSGVDTTAGQYGNLWIIDDSGDILIYGVTATTTALSWNGTTGKYSFTNPRDFLTNDVTKDIKAKDTLELLVVRTNYQGTPQLYAIVISVTPYVPGDADFVEMDIEELDIPTRVTENLTLPTSGTNGSTISWSSNNTAVVSNAGVVTRPAAGQEDVVVTLTATFTKGEYTTTETYEITVKALPAEGEDDEIQVVATFTFGDDNASKAGTESSGNLDGSEASTYTETNNGYTLTFSNMSKIYKNSYDNGGNSCLKLGTGSAAASFSFTVADDVEQVIIYVAGYKNNTASISINGGEQQNITTKSTTPEYTAIVVDTTVNKTVSFATLTGGLRCKIDKIEFLA